MKTIIQYIITGFFCMIAFSCSNDFLKDGQDFSKTVIGSQLAILPEFGITDYVINVPSAGNAKFSVVKKPDWLQVNTMSGKFVNDYAIINCGTSTQNGFSAIGFYNSTLVLDIDGIGKVLVPTAYLTGGNPTIQTETNLTLQYDYDNNSASSPLDIRNTGGGILLWGIAEKPDWITIEVDGGPNLLDSVFYMLPQDGNITLNVFYNSKSIPSNNLNGKIIIVSNDKNDSIAVINVSLNIGTPSFFSDASQLDFGTIITSLHVDISNQGNGQLIWKTESLPAWLSVSETSGTLLPYSSLKTLTFTCNRSQLHTGQQTQTIYLKTNDKNNPSYPITVMATGQ